MTGRIKSPSGGSASIRYMGFDQSKDVRTYRFERTTFGEATEKFSVTTEMALFTKHRVGIQEGPTLCLHVVTVDLEAGACDARVPLSLTEQHMLTYLASKPVPGARAHHKKVPRPTASLPHAV